jgi:hypothetical protein
MKQKDKPRNKQKICLFDEEEELLLKKSADKFNTYESEIIREALKDFWKKHKIYAES